MRVFLYLRSFVFCLLHLPIKQAIYIPILIGAKVIKKDFSGTIIIDSQSIYRGMIKLGIDKGSFSMGDKQSYLTGAGKIIFLGATNICSGFRFAVSPNGEILLGNRTFMNANVTISSNTIVSIGDFCNFGWNCTILDGDGHKIINIRDKRTINHNSPVIIENYCWLSAHCTITKGVRLCHHTITPYGSVINKSNKTPFVLWGGATNKILKEDIAREDFLDK